MATIDYKEKYEKAVQAAMLAKQDTESAVTVQTLEEIFPELIESEDEKRISSILLSIEYCKEQYPNLREYQYDIDWLKSLKERVQPQSELGEEDEDIRDNIIRDLKRLSGDMVSPNQTYQKEIQWLKSLRYQSRWKPSCEQMNNK